MSDSKRLIIGPGDPWAIENLAEELERRQWIGNNDFPYRVVDDSQEDAAQHIAKAVQWIEAAKDHIANPRYTGDPTKLLNEALVELALAVNGENNE